MTIIVCREPRIRSHKKGIGMLSHDDVVATVIRKARRIGDRLIEADFVDDKTILKFEVRK